jgi:hypothetical protein
MATPEAATQAENSASVRAAAVGAVGSGRERMGGVW